VLFWISACAGMTSVVEPFNQSAPPIRKTGLEYLRQFGRWRNVLAGS